MKKSIITALMILMIITFSVIPFTVKADTTYQFDWTADEGGINGMFITPSGTNSINLDLYGVQLARTCKSAIVIHYSFNSTYNGDFTLTFNNVIDDYDPFPLSGNIDHFSYSTSANNKKLTVYVNNATDISFVLISSVALAQNWLVGYSSNLTEVVDSAAIDNDVITNVRFTVNQGVAGQAHYYADALTSGYIYSDNISVNLARLDVRFNYSKLVNGNYVVFTFYVHSSQYYDDDYLDPLKILVRDHTNTLFYITDEVYRDIFSTHNTAGTSHVYLVTYYIPIGLLTNATTSATNNWEWQFATYTYDIANCDQVGFLYRGVVETLPNFANDETVNDLDDTTNDLNDIKDQEHDITSGFQSDLSDFNTNMDLSDFNFTSLFMDANNYFKNQMDTVYTESSGFQAFWVIPIILIILRVLLGGVV